MNLWIAESEVNRKFEAGFTFPFEAVLGADSARLDPPEPVAAGLEAPGRLGMWGKETK